MKSLIFAVLPSLLAFSDNLGQWEWGTVSATGLLGWYLWYTTKVVFPNHQKQVSEMQENFTEQFNSQRDHYENILEDVQTRQDKRHDKIIESLEKMTEILSDSEV